MNAGETMSGRPDFRKILDGIATGRDTREVFAAFVRLAAGSLAAETREADYLDEARRWDQAELEAFSQAVGALVLEMDTRPFEDILGPYYMECALSVKSAQRGGEFHTPGHIADLISHLCHAPIPEQGIVRLEEPACGAGVMVLAYAKAAPTEIKRLRVTASDISRVACDMFFVNTTLWGIPARVTHGNPLTGETWGAWPNIHFLLQHENQQSPTAPTTNQTLGARPDGGGRGDAGDSIRHEGIEDATRLAEGQMALGL